MKTKKLLSILLALMMMLSVVPMYASAAEALSASNVTQWPTITYKNGGDSINFGQTVGDTIIINDDEIVLDAAGNQVAGHFEHQKPTRIPDANDAAKANLTFVPDDTTQYSGFNKLFSKDVTFKVNKVTPVPVDENNAFPVATEVEAGANLSTSILTSPEYTNPYNAEEPKIIAAKWSWRGDTSNKTVNESGYYQAWLNVGSSGYNDTLAWVLVRIKGDTSEVKMGATIEEKPTVAETIVVGDKYSDLTLVGGKVVGMDGEELSGKFSFETDGTLKNTGTYIPTVVFTPDDEKYSSLKTNITLTVNPGKLAFINEVGTETIPEITIPYGLKMNDDIGNYLKSYLNTSASFNFTETQYYNEYIPVGTHDLTVKASCSNANYESEAVLPFKLTVEPVETAVTVKYDINKDNKNTYEIYVVKADVDGARPQGDFAIYVDGQLLKDGAKYSEHITWSPEKSKAYTVKVVYTPTANDPCLVADTEITVDAKLYRNITTVNTSSDGTKQFRCGEKIQVAANIPEFSGWVITDAAGNTVDLGVDLSAKSIELAVPDFDVKLEAKGKTSSGSEGLGNIFDMDFGDLSEGDSEWAIINIIRNLIAKFKSFLQQLIETFQSIGG